MIRRRPSRKLRRTFTLSPENVRFIEQQTRRRKLPSQSAFLDELLARHAREQKLVEYEDQVTAYYDNLSQEEIEEQQAWAQFSSQTLVLTDEELAHARRLTKGAKRRTIVGRRPRLQ